MRFRNRLIKRPGHSIHCLQQRLLRTKGQFCLTHYHLIVQVEMDNVNIQNYQLHIPYPINRYLSHEDDFSFKQNANLRTRQHQNAHTQSSW